MERSLFSFIWAYSKRDQLMLLGLTLITFPFLYATLELPKRIINDAIGSESGIINVFGYQINQEQFLVALCLGYLLSVLVHGLLKMRLNTMKGITAERLLRRFRFKLLSRMRLFPRSYFRNTSQGELVSMVTSEAEPMGGLMGDALAQPVFQAGQMLIIVTFLFLQSVWFGLAGIALIPLQAWIIPMLQRQINLLNKERIREIRALSAEIGETAAGMSDLRVNGGLRYRLAMFTDRLGRLFDVRFRIYQKKFFMKFLNNFITQLTPFFFYLIGGYLAIRGEITVGALVAALAAYKDLSGPWKELLTYYNQTQDMSLRWEIVTERFAPPGTFDEELFQGGPAEIPHLRGDIVLDKVTVRNADGAPVLEDISLTIPKGARVAVQVSNQSERTALAELLTREVMPRSGGVTIAGEPLKDLHQSVISARIGYAHSRPYLFDGTLGSNLLMPLMTSPKTVDWIPGNSRKIELEAQKAGNSLDPIGADWFDPDLANFDDLDEVRDWWFKIVHAMGLDEFMFRRMLQSRMEYNAHSELSAAIVDLRPKVAKTLQERGLLDRVNQFDPETFNPSIPLGGNLLFAVPKRLISQEELASDGGLLGLVAQAGLTETVIGISQSVIETLNQTFGKDGTSHPLFQALNIEQEEYERLVDIATRRREKGDASISQEDFSLLLTVPFTFTAEQIGPSFHDNFKEEILRIRRDAADDIRKQLSETFLPVKPDTYLPRLTILENALYGRISGVAGSKADEIEEVVANIISEAGLKRLVAEVIFDLPTGIGGANLQNSFHERAALSRAGIKRPDILILDKALASHDATARRAARIALRELMPETTMIFMEEKFENPQAYDLFVEIKQGRLDDVQVIEQYGAAGVGTDDLQRKQRVIGRTELFSRLDLRSQRLLAFAAQWYTASPGERIFSIDDKADAAYLCVSGQAMLTIQTDDGYEQDISIVDPGRLIGDLSVIMDETRQLNLTATSDVTFLRIGADEFRAVIENDPTVLMSLLQTVAGHLAGAAELLMQARVPIPQEVGPPTPPLE